jgi:glycosyltransferase involved in cell wall biosynthesis
MRVGLYNPNFATLGGGERRTARLAAHWASAHEVTLFVAAPLDVARVEAVFGIDLAGVEVVALGRGDRGGKIGRRGLDLFVNNAHGSRLPCPAPRGVYMCMFPEADRFDASGYDVITANSRYVAGWIQRRWGRPSEVVYSACRLIGADAAPKQPLILSVGRFFADTPSAHHKRQDVLIETFRRLVDDGGASGWQLHLVGNVGPAWRDRLYLRQLRRRARGYPIHIATGLDLAALHHAYRRASLYWHGAGYGSDPQAAPSKQEHFGMSIVEAMSAGAVPLAFDGGGPRETIEPGLSGELWRDPDDLAARTRRLMDDPAARAAMADHALARSRQFGEAEFLARMDAILQRLGAASAA